MSADVRRTLRWCLDAGILLCGGLTFSSSGVGEEERGLGEGQGTELSEGAEPLSQQHRGPGVPEAVFEKRGREMDLHMLPYDAHTSPEGHRIIAEALTKKPRSLGIVGTGG